MKKTLRYALHVVLFLLPFQILSAQSWEEKAFDLLPANYGVFGVKVVNENIIWAVAFDQRVYSEIPLDHVSKILKTTDGGDTWEIFDLEEATGRVSYNIAAFDATTAFINTQDYGNGSGRAIFKTEDGGATWVENFSHLAGGVWVRFFNEQQGVIINRGSIATTEDGGTTWDVVPQENIPAFREGEFTLISSGDNSCQIIDNHVWFGTSMGRVYRSKDKGKSWEAFETSLGDQAAILSVAFTDTLNGLAVDVNQPSSVFVRTRDGGETWESVETDSLVYLANLEYVPGSDSMIIGASDFFYPEELRMSALSIDYGKSWQIINDSIDFGSLDFISTKTGWGGRGILTENGQAALFKWVDDFSVDVREVDFNKYYRIYPNPASRHFLIESERYQSSEYLIYNQQGQLLQRGQINSDRETIDIQSLTNGIYYLKVLTADTVATKPLVKTSKR